MLFRSRLLAAALLFVPSAPAMSQGTAPARTAYDAAFFAPFAPSNALQLVERVPGFRLELGDTEVRGFGQAAGNVVINGERPSSKSEALDTTLARIPASRVARVEVGPGDLFGAEFSGKPMVVNLVLSDAGGLAGTASFTARRSYSGAVFPFGSVSLLSKRGNSTFSASIAVENNHNPEEGTDRLTALPGGALVEYRRKVNDIDDPRGSIAMSWAHDGGADRSAHLNGRIAGSRFALTQNNHVVLTTGTIRDDYLAQRYRRQDYELGGDVTRPLWGGGIKLVGLVTRRDRLNREVSFNRAQEKLLGGFAQDLDDRRDEAVARLVWTRTGLGGWTVETGGEGVLNILDSKVDLYSIDAADRRTRIDLPVDQAKVEEWRGEAFVNAGRSLAPALRIDLGLTYEASHLTVSGDAGAERSLAFLKPKATLDWNRKDSWHLQLAASRSVAQLQFEDFISAAELSTDRVNGGNADLVPQRAWELLFTAEHPILRDGLVKLELGYTAVGKVQDRVPTPEGYDAPGNLGNGRELIARATLDAALGGLGIAGGRLTARVSLVDSSVIDPYTQRARAFSGNNPWVVDASFRQDLGNYAWGLSIESAGRSTSYRRNEIDAIYMQIPQASLFGEYRPDAKTRLTLGIDNLFDQPGKRQRTFYQPDRGAKAPTLVEFRERNRHLLPYLSLKRDFG